MRNTRLVSINNIPMVIYESPECISDDIVKYNQFWEFELYKEWERYFPTKGLMLDIGANIGSHCLQFSQKDITIWAFELHHQNFSLLKQNCKNYPSIKCFNVGVGSNTSIVKYNDGHFSNSGVVKLDAYGSNDNIVIAIDDLKIEEELTFIKIDIEGHELSAFEGMRNTLLKHKPMIWVEDLNNNAKEYLKDLGYVILKSKEETFDYLLVFNNNYGK